MWKILTAEKKLITRLYALDHFHKNKQDAAREQEEQMTGYK